ncbi:MAG: hypothetical protein SFY69_10665 [Planctomycetota bacterium]|nr:hypothetical protein [Planctomycetota bacterium]
MPSDPTPPEEPAPDENAPAPDPSAPDSDVYELEPHPHPAGPQKDSLLEGFDEDADFERDPEVDAALGRPRAKKKPRPAAGPVGARVSGGVPHDDEDDDHPSGGALVLPSKLDPEIVVGAAIAVLVVAAAVGAATADAARLAAGVSVVYFAMLGFGVGVGAIRLAAHFQGVIVGSWSRAIAAIAGSVAAFQLVNALTLPALGAWGRLLLIPAAACAYILTLHALLRLPRERLTLVAGLHALGAIAAWTALVAYDWIADAGAGAAR